MLHREINDEMRESYHFQCHWEANLDDGTTVYQSDVEGKQADKSDWISLKEYCEETGTKITELFHCFRNTKESLGYMKEGYFFCKSVMGAFSSGENSFYYRLGFLENGIIKCKKYQVPGWTFVEEEEKNPEEYQECIISNV